MSADDIALRSGAVVTSSPPPSPPALQRGVDFNYALNLKIDKGFFQSHDSVWTCYRRNYFAVNVYYSPTPSAPEERLSNNTSISSVDTALSFMEIPKTPEPAQILHTIHEIGHHTWIRTGRASFEQRGRTGSREGIEGHVKESLGEIPIILSAGALPTPVSNDIWESNIAQSTIGSFPSTEQVINTVTMSSKQKCLWLRDQPIRNRFLSGRLRGMADKNRGHIEIKRKISPKLSLLISCLTLGVPCAALLYTPHWLGNKRALAGVVSGSAGITLPSLPEEDQYKVLRSLVRILWAVTYLLFLRLSYLNLRVNRPIYLFCSLLLAAHFGLGIAGSADSTAEAIRVILAFGPLVATACAALVYIPFQYTAAGVAGRSHRATATNDFETHDNTHGDLGLGRAVMHTTMGPVV
ncbi:hypothetical protein DM02DRAFT_693342 [Periconia macrospinosa]|uniref:Uncharacterized protein n=1 Tax=Periconia macrospinosa TaxID=97972 RepID=A0A2V1E1T0_9PLEO|nr:hypothetical protein DM02DRAFT_693342 [Periconia macrospinosa]